MKCGLICARSARTSASISRVRDASSSASSSCPDTQRATSSAARTSPADAERREHLQRADDPLLDGQRGDDHLPQPAGRVAARVLRAAHRGGALGDDVARERHRSARRGAGSGRPRRAGRWCRSARPRARRAGCAGAAPPSPRRRWSAPRAAPGVVSDAVCRVRNVVRSASVPRCRRPSHPQPPNARATVRLLEVDEQRVGVATVVAGGRGGGPPGPSGPAVSSSAGGRTTARKQCVT